jgi:hypothetical protein
VEVYFQGLGWVPFDPTPLSTERAVDLPWAPRADADTSTDPGQATAAPSAPTAAAPTTRQDRAADAAATANQGQGSGGTPWPLLVGAALVLVLLVAATPAAVRGLQRRRRLAAGTTGGLWDELAATALDVGVRLQPAWTPRRAAQELATVVGGPSTGGAADAVARLARAEEAACYGRTGGNGADPELVAALRTARQGLLRSAGRDGRLRALLWPASLVTGAGTRLTEGIRRRLGTLTRRRRPRPV